MQTRFLECWWSYGIIKKKKSNKGLSLREDKAEDVANAAPKEGWTQGRNIWGGRANDGRVGEVHNVDEYQIQNWLMLVVFSWSNCHTTRRLMSFKGWQHSFRSPNPLHLAKSGWEWVAFPLSNRNVLNQDWCHSRVSNVELICTGFVWVQSPHAPWSQEHYLGNMPENETTVNDRVQCVACFRTYENWKVLFQIMRSNTHTINIHTQQILQNFRSHSMHTNTNKRKYMSGNGNELIWNRRATTHVLSMRDYLLPAPSSPVQFLALDESAQSHNMKQQTILQAHTSKMWNTRHTNTHTAKTSHKTACLLTTGTKKE